MYENLSGLGEFLHCVRGSKTRSPDSASIEASPVGTKGMQPKTSTFSIPEVFSLRRLTDFAQMSFRQFGYAAASVPVLILAVAGMYGVERYPEYRESYSAAANSGSAAKRVDATSVRSSIPASSPVPA